MGIKTNRLGEELINNQGYKMRIIKYLGCSDIDVEFENGVIRRNVTYGDFKRKCLIAINYSDRIGEIRYNGFGSKMTVIDYIDSNNVYVEFDNGYKTKSTWNSFNRGSIKSPYCKSYNGLGYFGEGIYTQDDIWYNHWRAMVERVALNNDNFLRTYENATLHKEWCNYQEFCKWAVNNYYEVPNESMEIDKDILFKGNKHYSPETCVFVPHSINSLFVKADKSRGDLPIGVYWHERDQEYRAQCSYITNKGLRKNKWLGGYDNPNDAFLAYKTFKEENIKATAEKFKKYIPKKLYNALYKYIVEITD